MLREIGPRYTASILLRKIVPASLFYVRSFYLMRRDLQDWTAQADDGPDIRWACEDDAEAIAAIMWDAATVRQQMHEGARAAILMEDGRVRACSWFKQGPVDVDHWLLLVTPEDAVCSMFTFTTAAERGRGHFGRVVRYGSRDAAQRGLSYTFNIVDTLNRNSWTATEKAGGRRAGEVFAIGIAGWLAVRIDRSWSFGRWTPSNRFHLGFDLFDT